MTAQMTYQSPTLAPAYDELSIDENEVLPAILWAVASFLGVSASFVAWVLTDASVEDVGVMVGEDVVGV